MPLPASEISRDELGVVDQRIGLALLDDLACFQNIAVIGGFQRRARVLLDQQDRDAELPQRGNGAENLAHDQRCKAEARFVEIRSLGLAMSARPSASIWRSATRQRAGLLPPPLLQRGKRR